MKKRLTDKQLERFYKLMSQPMLSFDCGTLCADEPGGTPYCCDNSSVYPILFEDEYRWQRKQSRFWKKMPVKTLKHQSH